MNTKNNSRRRASREKIEKTFVEMLQTREISQITVSDICKVTGLNRSTFYANYADVYDLADKIRENLERDVENLYEDDASGKFISGNWVKLLDHIKENQLFYKTYFKLGYDKAKIELHNIAEMYHIFPEGHMGYHLEFFRAGFNAIIKMWLDGGCRETAEEINSILIDEYRGRKG